jgi:hypothetical protein
MTTYHMGLFGSAPVTPGAPAPGQAVITKNRRRQFWRIAPPLVVDVVGEFLSGCF